jgi:hypothetical protein
VRRLSKKTYVDHERCGPVPHNERGRQLSQISRRGRVLGAIEYCFVANGYRPVSTRACTHKIAIGERSWIINVRCGLLCGLKWDISRGLRSAMCGRLRVGKDFLHARRLGRCSHVFGLFVRFT